MKELTLDQLALVDGGMAYPEGSGWVVATGLYAAAVVASGGRSTSYYRCTSGICSSVSSDGLD